MNDVVTRGDLRQMSDDVLARVFERMDAEQVQRDQQHAENLSLMREIRAEVKATNGRVTRLESLVEVLGREYERIRSKWHDFRDSIQGAIAAVAPPAGDNRPMTQRDFGIVLTLMVATGTIAVAVTIFIMQHGPKGTP